MKKKIFVALLIITVLAMTAIIVAAATIYSAQYRVPQTALPPINASASFTINNQPWTNGTSIAWGQLLMGDNVMPITVTNTGQVAIASVTLNNIGLPSGWTETLTLGAPVGATYSGSITLHVDSSSSVSGLQSWASTITITSPPS